MNRPRFVVLDHQPGPKFGRTATAHWDWMFEIDQRLRTWASAPLDRFDRETRVACESLPDHRIAYLQIQGLLSGQRGLIRQVLAGQMQIRHHSADRLDVVLQWVSGGRPGTAAVTIQRTAVERSSSPDARCEGWSLLFVPGR